MHKIKSKEDFIIITGSNIIKDNEAKLICEEIMIKVAKQNHINALLLDLRELDLEQSKFDIFINYLSKLDLKKVAVILPQLISTLKFKLWKRKYKNNLQLAQFNNLRNAENWLLERS
ncbi:MAG: hypothetical protein ACQERJ_10470 [Bacillota bacterium]